jgi:hypothetical protein
VATSADEVALSVSIGVVVVVVVVVVVDDDDVGEMGKVQYLMGMGFPEAAVRAALAQADGNVELAAQLLLAMTN